MKRFLIVQIRPEDEAADNELESFLKFGNLDSNEILRIQVDRQPLGVIDTADFAGVIVGGGPANISDSQKSLDRMRMDDDIAGLLRQILAKDTPFLGACYGIGALVDNLGGTVSKERYSEPVGAVTITLSEIGKKDPLLYNIPESFEAFGGHKEACQNLPEGAILLAGSSTCPYQMIRAKNNIYATQFHPELDTNGIIVRINVYKHAGYFPPEEAKQLIEKVRSENVYVPVQILQNFVSKYKC